MSDVSSSEEAFFLVCKYLLTMNPPESILNPIQIVKGVPGFIVTLYQIAGQNRPCIRIKHAGLTESKFNLVIYFFSNLDISV